MNFPEAMAGQVDTREQRALALRRLTSAHYEIGCALGYLGNSDQGSIVLDDVRAIVDKIEALQRELEWRQRRQDVP